MQDNPVDHAEQAPSLPPHLVPTVSEARLLSVLDTAVDGIVVIDDQARVLVYNKCDRLDADGEALLAAEIAGAGSSALGPNAVRIAAVDHQTLQPLTRIIERRLWAQDRLIDAEVSTSVESL